MEPELLNVWDYERAAAERLEPGPYGYFAGGANDELTLADNVAAYRRWLIRPRVLVDVVGDVDRDDGARPRAGDAGPRRAGGVPAGGASRRRGGMARAAAAAGTVMCLSTMATATWDEIGETGVPRWFQLYVPQDPAVAAEVVAGAAEAGFSALVVTVDTPVLGRRERDHRTGFSVEHLLGLEWVARGPHAARARSTRSPRR